MCTLGINAGATNSARHFHKLAIRNNRNILIACGSLLQLNPIVIINIHFQNSHQPLIYTMPSRQTRTTWISIWSSRPWISWRSCVCCVCVWEDILTTLLLYIHPWNYYSLPTVFKHKSITSVC